MKKIILLTVISLEIFLFLKTDIIIKEFLKTLNICIFSLLPTMFYQVFFSNILINLNIEKLIPKKISIFFNLTKKEFAIVLLSMFSGYPNNIKLLKESKNEYLNYTTNYVNPIFLICTVGTLYLKNKLITIIILISHIISNLIILYIYRNKYISSNINTKNNINIYSSSLSNTINTLIIIFSNLLLISILISLLKLVLPFSKITNTFIIGLFEFSRGIYEISFLNISLYLKGLIILILITFSSLSIHFQMICINEKIKYIKFLLIRLLNVLISIIIYFILIFIITNV